MWVVTTILEYNPVSTWFVLGWENSCSTSQRRLHASSGTTPYRRSSENKDHSLSVGQLCLLFTPFPQLLCIITAISPDQCESAVMRNSEAWYQETDEHIKLTKAAIQWRLAVWGHNLLFSCLIYVGPPHPSGWGQKKSGNYSVCYIFPILMCKKKTVWLITYTQHVFFTWSYFLSHIFLYLNLVFC